MTFLLTTIGVVALLIFFNALYVAGEFATVSSRKTRISQLAAKDNPLARQLLPLMENTRALDRYVAACQLGITVSSLMLGAFGERVVAERLARPLELALTMVQPLLSDVGLSAGTAADVAAHTVAVTVVL